MYTEVAEFFRGYKDKEGVYHKEYEYREMDGTDEEAISKPKIKENGALITRTLLERCITRIGSINKEDVKPNEWTLIIQSLAMGDQDSAMMKIRELSIGENIKVSHKCPYCKTKVNTEYDLGEIPIIPYNGKDEIEFELPRGIANKDGEIQKTGKIRLPLGLDREILQKSFTQNPSVANTLLLARCVVSIGDIPVTDNMLRKLTMKDRNHLFNLLREELSFGYDVDDFEIECPNCGKDLKIAFNHADFL